MWRSIVERCWLTAGPVTPETAELIRRVRRLDLRARRVARTGLAGAWRSVHRGRGMAFEEVRSTPPW